MFLCSETSSLNLRVSHSKQPSYHLKKKKKNLSARPIQTCPLTLKNLHHFLISLYVLFIHRLIYKSGLCGNGSEISVITKKKKKNLWNPPQQFLTEIITDCFMIVSQKSTRFFFRLAAVHQNPGTARSPQRDSQTCFYLSKLKSTDP